MPTIVPSDQSEFGDARRYELVGGAIVAEGAPGPERGLIVSDVTAMIRTRPWSNREHRFEIGGGAAPRHEPGDRAQV